MKGERNNRKIYFGAGPTALPEEVLQEASEAVIDYNNSGLSILEIPHRDKLFDAILEESKSLVQELCGLNEDYEILWLQGGGRLQFTMIPMNFLNEGSTAGYIDSGHWAHEAIEAADYFGKASILSSSAKDNYNHLPEFPKEVPTALSYLHFTTNNTIYGTQWHDIPNCSVPLIADMSSDIFSSKRNYANCSMFYAVAQKNLGAAGVTLAVIKKDLLEKINRNLSPVLDYRAQIKNNSVLNTPPVFAIYTALLMLRWTKKKTIAAIELENDKKANLLYTEIERNQLFTPTVTDATHRSKMNICFLANNQEIEKGFLDFCTQQNIAGIKGHRSVGGFRVSIYNAIPIATVEKLVSVMREFETINN